MGVRRAVLKLDSQVIIGQVDKSRKVKNPSLENYFDMVRRMESSFEGFSVKNIPRLDNEHAEMIAMSIAQGLHPPPPPEVFLKVLKAPSVDLMERTILTVSPTHNED
jgi:hypothetical protein